MLCVAAVGAEKKPVTLAAAAATQRPDLLAPVWSPDGGRFLYMEARKLRLYECARKESRVLATLAELEGLSLIHI